MKPFLISRTVDFCDTDAAGLMHFSAIFRFMEAAEAAFFKKLDLPLLDQNATEVTGFPRIEVQARFIKPLYFQDEVEIELKVEAFTSQRIDYTFNFYKLQERDRIHTGKGNMKVAFARRNPQTNQLESTSMPQDWMKKIDQALK